MMRNIFILYALASLPAFTFTQAQDATPIPMLPPASSPAVHPLISKIAIGSCVTQDKPQPVLQTVIAKQPELFIFLGDNIYGDSRDMAVLEQKYATQAAHPEFSALRAAVPTIATWDDHDYGENDAGLEYPKKAESKEIFLKFWDEPAQSPRRAHPGIYTSYHFEDPAAGKRLQIIMLDTRTFRTPLAHNGGISSWKNDYHPDPNPDKTFLGNAQWAWLEDQLKVEADLRIIGTSIQFGHQHNGWESWTNFPAEVRKMVGLIKKTRANGVVFISGDVHWGELSILQADGCYPLHDLTASGINKEWDILEENRNRFGNACMDHHFGMIEIDWKAEQPSVSLRVHDITGGSRVEKTVKLSDLTFDAVKDEE
jgi:alkaline phosphatase D